MYVCIFPYIQVIFRTTNERQNYAKQNSNSDNYIQQIVQN